MPQKKVLSAVEVSNKDLMVLRSLMNLMNRELEDHWELSEQTGGDVALIDVDTETGATLWEHLARDGDPAIALSRQRKFPARFVLHKPLRSREMIRVLNELTTAASTPASQEGWQAMVLGHKPQHLTLAEHLRRHTWNAPVMLNGSQKPAVLIDPGSGAWYCRGELDELEPLFDTTLSPDVAKKLTSSEFVDRCSNMTQRPLSDLQWRAGLSQSRGAVHPDLVGAVNLMLTHVPRQARQTDRHMRLAQCLTRGPQTLEDLKEATNEDTETIAGFVNACYACGYLLVNRDRKQTALA